MPITLTCHVFGYTFTMTIKKKSNNRHSDLVPVYLTGTRSLCQVTVVS